MLGEGEVRRAAVRRNADENGARACDGLPCVTKRARLLGASGGFVFRVKIDNYPFAAKSRQMDGLSILRLGREIGSWLAEKVVSRRVAIGGG